MPILPVMDLLIVIAWSMLSIGGVLKAIYITTTYRPTFITLTPMECVMAAAVCLILALTLAARQWVKQNEPQMLATRRAVDTLEAYEQAHANAARMANGEREHQLVDPQEGVGATGSLRG